MTNLIITLIIIASIFYIILYNGIILATFDSINCNNKLKKLLNKTIYSIALFTSLSLPITFLVNMLEHKDNLGNMSMEFQLKTIVFTLFLAVVLYFINRREIKQCMKLS